MPLPLRVSTEFGENGHPGIDLVAPMGTPIPAAAGGVVLTAGWNNGGYGNYVVIDSGSFITAYAHMSSVSTSAGAFVSQGTIVGLVGSTGNSTGPHLHFEYRVGGSTRNPRSYCG